MISLAMKRYVNFLIESLVFFFYQYLHYVHLGKQIIMDSLCSMVFCSPDIDKKCLWELYSIFNSLIIIHFLFSYLSFAVLEKNMVTDDSRMMTLGVMKMAHAFGTHERIFKTNLFSNLHYVTFVVSSFQFVTFILYL